MVAPASALVPVAQAPVRGAQDAALVPAEGLVQGLVHAPAWVLARGQAQGLAAATALDPGAVALVLVALAWPAQAWAQALAQALAQAWAAQVSGAPAWVVAAWGAPVSAVRAWVAARWVLGAI